MKNIGIIGFGRFGKLLHKILKEDFKVMIFDKKSNIKQRSDFEKITLCDALFFCVPISSLESTVKEYFKYIKKGSTILDVASVKVEPVKILKKYFSTGFDIIPTHPMFGPDSAKDGLKYAVIAFCPVKKSKAYIFWKLYFKKKKFKVVEMTPEKHDLITASGMAFTHFIGEVMKKMEIKSSPLDTKTFKMLLDIKKAVSENGEELFYDIQKNNSYTVKMRSDLKKAVSAIEKKIKEKK